MKTYNEYLKIIKNRERKERGIYDTKYPPVAGEDRYIHVRSDQSYSVEIMGMMMQDFLNELPSYVEDTITSSFQFDYNGKLKVSKE